VRLDAGVLAGAVAVAAVEDLSVAQHDRLEQAVLPESWTSSPNSGLSTSSSGKRAAAGWESRAAGGETGCGAVEYSK
jgi:hypothetical protein